MPHTSGSCLTPNEFLDDLMVYAQAQGWTLLRGAESLSDSGLLPFNARYLRVDFADSLNSPEGTSEVSSTLRVAGMTIRATVGGADLTLSAANLSSSGFNTGFPPSNVLDGLSTTYWGCEPDDLASLYYDFGADQIIRQFTFTSNSDTGIYMPRKITIYRSDDGINWGLVYVIPTISSWTAGETKALSLPADGGIQASSTASGGVRRSVEYWLQGPGYDAARRVYLGFRSYYDFTTSNGGFDMNAATSFDADLDFEDMSGGLGVGFPRLQMFTGGEILDYHIYINSTRIIGILKTSAGDYASFYAGFLAAFGNPDEYPFPLYLAGSTTASLNVLWNATNPANAAFFDPGTTGGKVLDQLNVWQSVGNQSNTLGANLDPIDLPTNFVWPWHLGAASTSAMPYSMSGDTDSSSNNHWLNSMIATDQADLPTFDATVYNVTYGAFGTLQGVVGIPGAGVLTPENVITIDGDNYRTFPNRTRRLGNHWIAIQE